MSSSRSITGARQRRAGEQAPPVTRGNTSIGSQQIFAQQQQQQNQPKQFIQKNVNTNSRQGAPSQTIQELEQAFIGKLSIPKAFTLVTLRLGRLEQYIQQLQEEEYHNNTNINNQTSEKNNTLNENILKNVMDIIEPLEKKISEKNDSTSQLEKFEKELRETKDLLMMIMIKHEKLSLETNNKFIEMNEQITQLNNKLLEKPYYETIEVYETNEECTEENTNTTDEQENITINLKEIIENELSNK